MVIKNAQFFLKCKIKTIKYKTKNIKIVLQMKISLVAGLAIFLNPGSPSGSTLQILVARKLI